MITELSYIKFKETFGDKMIEVTQSANPVVDIWDYVKELVDLNIIEKYVYDNTLVEVVYRNSNSTFDHVLLPTDRENVFIVLVIDLIKESVFGYFRLDLNNEYGT